MLGVIPSFTSRGMAALLPHKQIGISDKGNFEISGIKDMEYIKGANYYLVLKDEEEMVNTEIERIAFTIDLIFGGSIQF
jgi:hypothetical protein